jgi:hypothetical protein
MELVFNIIATIIIMFCVSVSLTAPSRPEPYKVDTPLHYVVYWTIVIFLLWRLWR